MIYFDAVPDALSLPHLPSGTNMVGAPCCRDMDGRNPNPTTPRVPA